MNKNPANYYVFSAANGLSVTVLRGTAAPKMTAGGGGWQVTPRPRRVALTQWKGRDPYRMDVPVMFDGYADDISVESDIAKLNQMQMGTDLTPPPKVFIKGAVPVKGIWWVIENIDWGDLTIWRNEGTQAYRLRQDATVKLIQVVDAATVKISGKGKLTVSSTGQVYKAKTGDTLRSISKKFYKTVDKWQDIWRANPQIKDPKKIKKDTQIRIP